MLGIPKLVKVDNVVCGLCQLGKHMRAHHQVTLTTATTKPLELLHIDLMGFIRTYFLGGKRYIMVVVDDLRDLHGQFC